MTAVFDDNYLYIVTMLPCIFSNYSNITEP